MRSRRIGPRRGWHGRSLHGLPAACRHRSESQSEGYRCCHRHAKGHRASLRRGASLGCGAARGCESVSEACLPAGTGLVCVRVAADSGSLRPGRVTVPSRDAPPTSPSRTKVAGFQRLLRRDPLGTDRANSTGDLTSIDSSGNGRVRWGRSKRLGWGRPARRFPRTALRDLGSSVRSRALPVGASRANASEREPTSRPVVSGREDSLLGF